MVRFLCCMVFFVLPLWAGTQLESKSYQLTFEQAWAAAEQACANHSWKIKESSKTDGVMVVKTKVSGFTWGAVLNINISKQGKGVKVHVTASTNQIGDKKKLKKDLGRFFGSFENEIAVD